MWPALLCMVRLVTMEPVLRHLRPWKEDEREKLWEWAGAGGQAGADHLPVPRSQPGQSGVLSPALLHLHHHTTAVHYGSVHLLSTSNINTSLFAQAARASRCQKDSTRSVDGRLPVLVSELMDLITD